MSIDRDKSLVQKLDKTEGCDIIRMRLIKLSGLSYSARGREVVV